ncbi:hypothetical protein Tco_1082304 [Tanacetum coccineum]|uniref:Uncharacterized protein n=1 Tax=Tanacetum coccineum TaxID=301880 RepID=A0ABQ5I035_9ASTR
MSRSIPEGMSRSVPEGMSRSVPEGMSRSVPKGMSRSVPVLAFCSITVLALTLTGACARRRLRLTPRALSELSSAAAPLMRHQPRRKTRLYRVQSRSRCSTVSTCSLWMTLYGCFIDKSKMIGVVKQAENRCYAHDQHQPSDTAVVCLRRSGTNDGVAASFQLKSNSLPHASMLRGADYSEELCKKDLQSHEHVGQDTKITKGGNERFKTTRKRLKILEIKDEVEENTDKALRSMTHTA